jgi:hypothetical protein
LTTNRLALVLTSVLILAVAAPASADVFTFDTIQRGWYNNSDFNDPTNKNYIAGQINIGVEAILFNDFFAFAALTGLNGPTVSIDLILFNPDFGYTSTQASENYQLAGYAGNVADLIAGGTVPGTFAGLASGTVYGGGAVSAGDNNTFIDFSLNAAAIAAISAASGEFAIGGQLTGIPAADTDTRFIFGGTGTVNAADGATYLRIVVTAPVTSTVPEPGSILLFATGIGATLLLRRKAIAKA